MLPHTQRRRNSSIPVRFRVYVEHACGDADGAAGRLLRDDMPSLRRQEEAGSTPSLVDVLVAIIADVAGGAIVCSLFSRIMILGL